MADPFIGEIRMFAGNFAPRSYAFCDGQLQSISQNNALFSLFGTIYGGDGRTSFALPDMRGRVPVHAGTGPGLTSRRQGGKEGVEEVTLTTNQLPSHAHQSIMATPAEADNQNPENNYPACTDNMNIYSTDTTDTNMAGSASTNSGGSQPHSNIMPYLCINFIVALFGTFPSRS